MRPLNLVDFIFVLRMSAVIACLAATSHVRAAALDLHTLMGLLAQARSGEATFTEERRVQQLERTLVSKGRLSFKAPDTFVRETLQPRPERLAVVGNQLTLSRGNRTQTVLLDSMPEAAVIVEAVRGTLTGNRTAVEQHFFTTVQGSAEQWQLELMPRDARLRDHVTQIRVAGRQELVREVRITLADGDTSLMRIEPLVAAPAARP